MIIFNHLESFYSTYLFITSAADCLKQANHKFKQKFFFIGSDPERLGTANQSPLFQHCQLILLKDLFLAQAIDCLERAKHTFMLEIFFIGLDPERLQRFSSPEHQSELQNSRFRRQHKSQISKRTTNNTFCSIKRRILRPLQLESTRTAYRQGFALSVGKSQGLKDWPQLVSLFHTTTNSTSNAIR